MFPTNSDRLIGVSDAFSAFVYGYPSSCPRAHCTPNKSVTTLRYTRRHGPVYTGHACRYLPSAVPWISEDRLFMSNVWSAVQDTRHIMFREDWTNTELNEPERQKAERQNFWQQTKHANVATFWPSASLNGRTFPQLWIISRGEP